MVFDVNFARTVLSLAAVMALVPTQAYHLPEAQQPLPLGYEPIAPGQENLPQDTPEVARAKAEHLAAVQRAVTRTRTSNAAVPLTLSAPAVPIAPAWSLGFSGSTAAPWANSQQVDTFEVAAEKAKHFAAVEAAKRISSPDLPAPVQDTPEVAAARAEHLAAVAAAEARNAALSTPSTPTAPQHLTKVHASQFAHAGFLRPQTQEYYSAPVPVVPTYQPPTQYLAPASYSNSIVEDDGQYRGNEEPSSGEYSYTYNDGLSSKTESRTSDGITRGSYSYYDANGVLQSVSYEADDVNGFRVYGSNLPQVSPAVAAALGNPDDPAAAVAAASAGAIQDTPEVAAAKQAHLAAYREALQRLQQENH